MFSLGDIDFKEVYGSDADDIGYWYSVETMVRLYHYPYCCTGAVIANLQGGGNNFGESDEEIDSLADIIKAWIHCLEEGYLKDERKQFLSACTTDGQEEANEVLKELGFERSGAIPNNKYGGYLYTWVYALDNEEDEDE